MAICPECGNHLPDGSRYCQKCGNMLDSDRNKVTFCRRCGKMLPSGAEKCDRCSASPDVDYHVTPKKKKNWFAVIAVAAAAVLLIAIAPRLLESKPAHSGSPGEATQKETQKDTAVSAPGSISLTVWTPMEDQVEDGWLAQMMERFEQAHPEYDITWDIGVCGAADVSYLLRDDPAAAPDVFIYYSDCTSELMDYGVLAPLEGEYLEQVEDDNCSSQIDSVSLVEGGVYGFPISSNTWFMYYNKAVYTEEDVRSLDTMLEKGTVAFPMSTAWYNSAFFFANGCTLFGAHGNDPDAGIQFGGEAGYGAAKKMVELMQHPHFVNDDIGQGRDGIRNGSIDAYFSGTWDFSAVYSALGENTGVAMLPTVNIGGEDVQLKAMATTQALGVNPNAEDFEAAMELAAFLASPDSQLLRFELQWQIPTAQVLREDPLILESSMAAAQMDTMANASVPQSGIPEMSNYWTMMTRFGSMIVTQEVDISNYKARVDTMCRQINAY